MPGISGTLIDMTYRTLDPQESVKDMHLTAPPGGPVVGDRYIVGSPATSDWAGKEGQITQYTGLGWDFYVPTEGFFTYVEDQDVHYCYENAAWVKRRIGPLAIAFSKASATNFLLEYLYATDLIHRVIVKITEAWGTGATMTLGFPADNDELITSGQVSLQTLGTYEFQPDRISAVSESLRMYFSHNSSGTGVGIIYVEE